jgi:hypothetical protein
VAVWLVPAGTLLVGLLVGFALGRVSGGNTADHREEPPDQVKNLVSLLPRGEEAKIKIAKSNLEALTHQCEIYANDHNGQMPPTLAALVNPGDGHPAYVREKALKDPWGSVFQYDPSGAKNGGLRPDIWTEHDGKQIGNWD